MRSTCTKLICSMMLSVMLAGTGFASTVDNSAKSGSYHKEGELIVKYHTDISEEGKLQNHKKHGAKRKRVFRSFNMEHVKLRPGLTVAQAIKEYSSDPAVEYAEPDYLVEALNTPTDPKYYSQWALSKISAPAAWDNTVGDGSIVVAVIDSGVNFNHPDLKANMWVNGSELNGVPGVDDDGNGVIDDVFGYNAVANNGNPMDDNGHGTHVAGIIGAVGNNGQGVSGVNWNVKIMPCKFMNANGSGYTSDAIECLQYIRTMKDRGVNIVATNNSWGGGYSQALFDAIKGQQDILFIAAAGNSTVNNDSLPTYPAGYDLPNIISVAATTSTDSMASFSNYGRRTVQIGAPGDLIYSTLVNGSYGYKSGTSMAAPYVTGLAALIKAKYPSLDWRGIKNLILSGGDKLTALTGRSITGRRINAFGSLTCVDSRVFSAIKVPAVLTPGTPATLSAVSINCAAPLGPVTVGLSGGEVFVLHDDGVAPDAVAGDGVFTVTFTPVRSVETLQFSSPAGSETVSVGTAQPLSVTTTSLPAGATGVVYNQSISAGGGIAPYMWSMVSGSLPPGLTLYSKNGMIYGTPSVKGTFVFTVQTTDAQPLSSTRQLAITIN